jgi:hypothetical protein
MMKLLGWLDEDPSKYFQAGEFEQLAPFLRLP